MDQISIEALIFMGIGWTFVIWLVVSTMKKILTGKIEYDDDN